MMRAIHFIILLAARVRAGVKDLFVEMISSTRGLTTAAVVVNQGGDVGGVAPDFKAKSVLPSCP
jgi:hypothetical protein